MNQHSHQPSVRRRIRRTIAATLGALTLFGGVAALESGTVAAAATSCAEQCISNVVRTSTANSVTIQATTDVKAKVTVELKLDGTSIFKQTETTFLQGVHPKVTIPNLKPFVRYRYIVTAVDSKGNKATRAWWISTKITPSVNRAATNTFITFATGKAGKAKLTVTAPNGSTKTVAETTATTQHYLSVSGLQPATKYGYKIDFTDPAGVAYSQTGSFTTKQRRLTVTISKITVTNDSDITGAGELGGKFQLNGVDAPLWSGEKSVSDGNSSKYIYPNITKVVDGKASVSFKAVIWDDDCDVGLCTSGTNYPYANGTSDDADWSAVATTFSTVAPGAEPAKAFKLTVNSYVGFTIEGTYTWSVFDV